MSDKDLISAAPGFNRNSPYFYKPELSSLSAASKETLSLQLTPKHGLYVAPHHKEALQDQAQNKPDKSEPVLDSSVTVTNQAGFKALVSSKQTAIKGLTFDCGKVTLHTTAQLIKNGWPALRSLNLSSSRLGADGIKHLVNGLWPELMHLDLSNNSLDEKAMFLMSDVGVKWPNLETLDLRSVPNIHHPLLSPLSSLAPISSSPLIALPHIILLACSTNQLNAGAMVHLIKPKFSKLQTLDLRYATKKMHLDSAIGLLYMAYPHDFRHNFTLLPRLQPYPVSEHWLL